MNDAPSMSSKREVERERTSLYPYSLRLGYELTKSAIGLLGYALMQERVPSSVRCSSYGSYF